MNNMKGLGGALPNPKGGKGKAAAAEEEDDDEEFDPSQLSASERAELAKLVKGGLTSNPELIKALQGRLDGLVGRNSGYIDSLPSKARALRHQPGGCATVSAATAAATLGGSGGVAAPRGAWHLGRIACSRTLGADACPGGALGCV